MANATPCQLRGTASRQPISTPERIICSVVKPSVCCLKQAIKLYTLLHQAGCECDCILIGATSRVLVDLDFSNATERTHAPAFLQLLSQCTGCYVMQQTHEARANHRIP